MLLQLISKVLFEVESANRVVVQLLVVPSPHTNSDVHFNCEVRCSYRPHIPFFKVKVCRHLLVKNGEQKHRGDNGTDSDDSENFALNG